MYLLAICISSLEKCSNPLLILKSVGFFVVVFFLLLSDITSLHILDINPFSDIWFAYGFLPFHELSFHSVDYLFCYAKHFLFDVALLVYFYFSSF